MKTEQRAQLSKTSLTVKMRNLVLKLNLQLGQIMEIAQSFLPHQNQIMAREVVQVVAVAVAVENHPKERNGNIYATNSLGLNNSIFKFRTTC